MTGPSRPAPHDGVNLVRHTLARAGLVLVLVAVSAFALLSSAVISRTASDSARASQLSTYYTAAVEAIAAQESLERKYRLEPGAEVRKEFTAAGASMAAAMHSILAVGAASDRDLVNNTRQSEAIYLQSMQMMFAAVDRNDEGVVLEQDRLGDASFGTMQASMRQAALTKDQDAERQLQELQRAQIWNSRLTPAVFVAGLLLAMALSLATRGYRRRLEREQARAVHAAGHDELTGLPNRTTLAKRMDQELADHRRDAKSGLALLVLDVDRFKEVNDTFGHRFGDLVLAQLGQRLLTVLDRNDLLARLGGDEFAVLLPGMTDASAAAEMGRQLSASLQHPFIVDGVSIDVDASIGVALAGLHGSDPDGLLRCADIAMYEAKTLHVGVAIYDPVSDRYTPAKLALLGDLRRALERGEMLLHYQPKVALRGGAVVGVEALIRWEHPYRGLVMPDEFIPLVERTALIGPLTRHVVDTALRQARSWMERGAALPIAVNLSARNLDDQTLPEMLSDLLESHQVPPSLLQVEITESALAVDPTGAQILLRRLSAAGITISIDDFGAGYTSIGQLKDLPVQELKIDRSFINSLHDSANALIVRSIIDLGHDLNLSIVAEGLENADDQDTLTAYGCDTAQGYLFVRPLPPELFDAWYAHQRQKQDSRTPAGID